MQRIDPTLGLGAGDAVGGGRALRGTLFAIGLGSAIALAGTLFGLGGAAPDYDAGIDQPLSVELRDPTFEPVPALPPCPALRRCPALRAHPELLYR